jgi:hypothetical protein
MAQSAAVLERARRESKRFVVSATAVTVAVICRLSHEDYPIGEYRTGKLRPDWYTRSVRLYSQTKNPETPFYCAIMLNDESVLRASRYNGNYASFCERFQEGFSSEGIIAAFEYGIDFDLLQVIEESDQEVSNLALV